MINWRGIHHSTLLSRHHLGSRAAPVIGVTASRSVKSLAFFLRATKNHARTIQLLICILDQGPICISNSFPLLQLIIFSPLWRKWAWFWWHFLVPWCINRGQRHGKSTNHARLQNKEVSNKKNKTYLYCETAICCRFSQVDVVEFSDEGKKNWISFWQ